MNHRPADLYHGIIDFFGILIPGAVVAYMHGSMLLRPLGTTLESPTTTLDWVPLFIVATILGHFVLGFSAPLDRIAVRFLSSTTRSFCNAAMAHLRHRPEVPGDCMGAFYAAFSFVTVSGSGALIELERQAAGYKLFRSLTLVFLLDIPLAVLAGSLSLDRALAVIVIVAMAGFRYLRLLDWTYRLAFDYFIQLQSSPRDPRP